MFRSCETAEEEMHHASKPGWPFVDGRTVLLCRRIFAIVQAFCFWSKFFEATMTEFRHSRCLRHMVSGNSIAGPGSSSKVLGREISHHIRHRRSLQGLVPWVRSIRPPLVECIETQKTGCASQHPSPGDSYSRFEQVGGACHPFVDSLTLAWTWD